MKSIHQNGFTLIELLVVIAILGVVAAVAVPNVLGFIGAGTEEIAKHEYQNVLVAVTAAMTVDPPIDITVTDAQIISGAPGVGQFLIKDTEFKYTIDAAGNITQGERIP